MTLDQIKGAVADLARPFSIIATSASAAAVPVIVVWRMAPDRFDLFAAAALVAALYAGVGALYWGKAWENTRVDTAAAKATTATPAPGTATVVAAPDVKVEATVTDASDDADPTMYGGPRA